MTYMLDCIARYTVCGLPVNSIWPVTDLVAVTESWLNVEEYKMFCISCLKAPKVC